MKCAAINVQKSPTCRAYRIRSKKKKIKKNRAAEIFCEHNIGRIIFGCEICVGIIRVAVRLKRNRKKIIRDLMSTNLRGEFPYHIKFL